MRLPPNRGWNSTRTLIGPFRLQPFYPFLLSPPGTRTASFLLSSLPLAKFPCHSRPSRKYFPRCVSFRETSGRWNVALEFFRRVSSRSLPSLWLRFTPFSRPRGEKCVSSWGETSLGRYCRRYLDYAPSTKTREFNFA